MPCEKSAGVAIVIPDCEWCDEVAELTCSACYGMFCERCFERHTEKGDPDDS